MSRSTALDRVDKSLAQRYNEYINGDDPECFDFKSGGMFFSYELSLSLGRNEYSLAWIKRGIDFEINDPEIMRFAESQYS